MSNSTRLTAKQLALLAQIETAADGSVTVAWSWYATVRSLFRRGLVSYRSHKGSWIVGRPLAAVTPKQQTDLLHRVEDEAQYGNAYACRDEQEVRVALTLRDAGKLAWAGYRDGRECFELAVED